MGGLLWRSGVDPLGDGYREPIYGFLAAIFSHPDEGKWGRVLHPQEQRSITAAVDLACKSALKLEYPLLDGELPASELDARMLILELCQPLEHLKAEYERVLCRREPADDCSPFELDHRGVPRGSLAIEQLGRFATTYRAFGFLEDEQLPARPDHIAFELGFMYHLALQQRLATRLAPFDPLAARLAARCDLAQRNFFGDHLAHWVTSFASGLQEAPGGGYLEALGRVLAAWMPLERLRFGVTEEFEEAMHPGQELAVGG
ncbi:MAG: molecular chaperone TorD family protein [Isosphaeraceae bacterium]